MERTVCELFAGVGGFRCGLNGARMPEDMKIEAELSMEQMPLMEEEPSMEEGPSKEEKWRTVWFSQWEPAEKKTQYAHDCYVYHFGTCLDNAGRDTTNVDIEEVDKSQIPDFNLLVGGFPCQDYSVASSLASSKGLEGKKGILWWSIREVLEVKKPPFVLLENVDRLLKSPASQRGRDFGIILACFRDEGYTVEWRVINAADYGLPQRRRRVFLFACREDTMYDRRQGQVTESAGESQETERISGIGTALSKEGFFARAFPVDTVDPEEIKKQKLPEGLGELSDSFRFGFENAGIMRDGTVYTAAVAPKYEGERVTLGDIMESGEVDSGYFIPTERLYYTDPKITHSDETKEELSKDQRKTWQYLKGAKKLLRKAANGHTYVFSEGAIPMVDEYDKPARTMLTSEGSFSRTTHIVKDKKTGRIRLLTAGETERIQGFPTDHTKYCLTEGKVVEMPLNKRRFMMGNALVVGLVERMGKVLEEIFAEEG